ncbi:MAG: hypothetical protein K2L96_08665 [Muribaculaceae bacterium]|nr:hypothetical protein [Muribaculaceae bacterium]
MKKATVIALAALTVATAAQARSWKRGVGENAFQYKAQLEALAPGVSWYYNWGTAPGRALVDDDCMEFIPMCWNGWYNANSIREYVQSHPQVKYLLGFNEPNFHDQANMTPQQAADAWPAVQALAAELGLKLVAPVVNFSPNAPYHHPTSWMDEFVALVGTDAFDCVALHCYGGPEVLKQICTEFHNRYGKEVWMTEFSLIYDGLTSNTPAAQISAMMQSVEWMEKTEWMGRYGWFKATGDYDNPKSYNWGLIKPGKGEDPRELSEQGMVYTYMSEFDTEVYHAVNELVAASEYISQSSCMLGSGSNPACPRPIEITSFEFAAWLDYQFDVPETGDYTLELTVSGQGEPVRFDPNIEVVNMNGDREGTRAGVSGKFTLSGDNSVYTTVSIPVKLEAGKRTIRLKNAQPSEPSGIHISTLMLKDGDAGVQDVVYTPGCDTYLLYSLQGVQLRKSDSKDHITDGLPAGIYILNGEKIAIR